MNFPLRHSVNPPLSALRSPLSALRSPLSALRSPLSARWPESASGRAGLRSASSRPSDFQGRAQRVPTSRTPHSSAASGSSNLSSPRALRRNSPARIQSRLGADPSAASKVKSQVPLDRDQTSKIRSAMSLYGSPTFKIKNGLFSWENTT